MSIWKVTLAGGMMLLTACTTTTPGKPGQVLDEARRAARDAASFHAASEDYFHDMDGAPALSADEITGRNTWIVWTGGDDKLWDTLTATSFGALDFLKTLSSNPKLKFSSRQSLELSGPGQ